MIRVGQGSEILPVRLGVSLRKAEFPWVVTKESLSWWDIRLCVRGAQGVPG